MTLGLGKTKWVVEGRVAVSPMPASEELEFIAGKFNTIFSLATWAEHASKGYDPRAVRGTRLVWLPVGMYNAPYLVEFIRSLEAVDEPVLVHGLHCSGRTAVGAVGYIILKMRLRLPEALALAGSKGGCSIQTAPQQSVLEALDYAVRTDFIDAIKEFKPNSPEPEYALLLARELGVQEGLEDRSSFLWQAASLLARHAGYNIAKVRFNASERSLKILCWVERGAHPRSAWSVGCPEELSLLLEEVLAAAGVERIEIVNFDRFNVPWVS